MSDSVMLRNLIRKRDRAALASLMVDDKTPYASMVMTATDPTGNILLLLSDLAVHSQNIAMNGSVSLLFEDDFGITDPLLGLRVSLQATMAKTEQADHKRRYLNRHPGAQEFAGFSDFQFYKADVKRLHFVAGFGQINWVEKQNYLLSDDCCDLISAIEEDVINHMNEDHKAAIGLIAVNLAGKQGGDWIMTGLDPEGYDFRNGSETARLSFENPVSNADEIRNELTLAAAKARSVS